MKILHVLAQLPAKTGSGVYYSNLVEGFKKLDYEQKAIFGYQDDFKWNVLDKKDQYAVYFKNETLCFPIPGMSNVMPYDNTLYSDMTEAMFEVYKEEFRKALENVKRDFEPDVIFAHHLWILTSLVKEIFTETKIIGICHNTDLRQAKMNPHLKEKYVKRIQDLDCIFSASKHQNEEIVNIYGVDARKIKPVGGGFNQNIFYAPEKKEYDEKIRLVFCAKIDQSKGIYELIEVFKDLGVENIVLDIIGTPNEENQKRIEQYINGDENINLYNVKDQLALGDELRKKDIYLMPSYYEGLGLMAIESLACGLYVVTTEIPALIKLLGEEIRESGVIEYVKLPRIYDIDKPVKEDLPEFKEELKRAILIQIEKVREKKEFNLDIQNKIKSFSWEGLVLKMDKIAKELR